ncbi:MAG: cytochrome c biogenesis protein CcdA [Candidatus Omnitrophica bacterium]|nr:cytochrome c biogenesis protein CcdA [Candidatus Omnitrophota bacterium]
MKSFKTFFVILIAGLLFVLRQSFADTSPIRLYVFYSQDCSECGIIKPQGISTLSQRTGWKIEPEYFDIDNIENYQKLTELEAKYEDTDNELPVVFIGKYVLGGVKEIEKDIEKIVKEYAEKGGVEWPDEMVKTDKDEIAEKSETIKETEEMQQIETQKTVYLAFFYELGCKECSRTFYLLKYLGQKYPFLVIKKFDLKARENKVLFEAIAEKKDMPEKHRLLPATIFVGSEYLQQKDISQGKIEELIEENKTGSVVIWDVSEEEMAKAEERIEGRFSSLKAATVFFAGLIDGFNPCAFAVLVFFISYMTVVKKKGKDMLFVGLMFITGVFLAYVLIGMGVLYVIFKYEYYTLFSSILNGVVGAGCLILGYLSFRDFLKAKRGDVKDITLKLPKAVNDRIHSTIISKMRLPHYMAGSFIAGITVSVLEFACTGQVYLPTIVYITGNPGLKLKGMFYLILYNLFFVLPLFIILALSWMGTTAQKLAEFSRKNVAVVKILLALFFFSVGVFLLVK